LEFHYIRDYTYCEKLPADVEKLTKLKNLNLEGANLYQDLPEWLSELPNLRLINIDHRIEKIPEALKQNKRLVINKSKKELGD
jgi:hypothetical protein